jgi:hypothetical protein
VENHAGDQLRPPHRGQITAARNAFAWMVLGTRSYIRRKMVRPKILDLADAAVLATARRR